MSEIDELYKKEEQIEGVDEEMDEMETQALNARQTSDEIKNEDQNRNQLTVESNSRVISDETNSKITSNQTNNNIKSEDTSNGSNGLNSAEMDIELQEEQTIGDKEFEPIYDP